MASQASMSMETGLSSTGAPSTSTSGVSQRSRMQPVVPPKIMRRDIHGMSEEAQHNILREQRALRQREIDDSGWASDIHKPYKPLGAPDLEREMPAPQLTSKTPRALARKNMMARAGKKQAGNGALGAGERRAGGDGMEESKSTIIIPISHRPVHQDNGWSLLQTAISKSSSRMTGCKFGSSYPDVMLRQGFQMHSQSPLKASVTQVDLKGEISRLSAAHPSSATSTGRLPGFSTGGGRRASGGSDEPSISASQLDIGPDGPNGALQHDASNAVVFADEQQLKALASSIRFPPIGMGLQGQAQQSHNHRAAGSSARKPDPRNNRGITNNPYMSRLYEVMGGDPGETALASVVQGLLPNPALMRLECDPEKAVKTLLEDFKQCKESLKDELSQSLADLGAMLGENYVYRSLALRTEGPATNNFSARRWELEAERSRVLERLQAIDAHPWYNRLMFLLTQSHHGLTTEQEAIMTVVKDVIERGEDFTDEELFGLMLLVPRSYHSLDAIQKIFLFIRDEVQLPFELWITFVRTHNMSQYVNLSKRDAGRNLNNRGTFKHSRQAKRNQRDSASNADSVGLPFAGQEDPTSARSVDSSEKSAGESGPGAAAAHLKPAMHMASRTPEPGVEEGKGGSSRQERRESREVRFL